MEPRIIDFRVVEGDRSRLSALDDEADLPIIVKHAYWIYGVEGDVARGNHAHLNSDRILVCIAGSVAITIESSVGKQYSFTLSDPSKGLLFPRLHWINLNFSIGAALMVFTSCAHNEDIAIRDYRKFKEHDPSLSIHG